MICTAFPFIDPILGRILAFYLPLFDDPVHYQGVSFAVSVVALGLLMFAERRQRQARWVFPAMLAATVVVYALWFTLAQSPAWHAVARWFLDLQLP